jgi:hypothetical protein
MKPHLAAGMTAVLLTRLGSAPATDVISRALAGNSVAPNGFKGLDSFRTQTAERVAGAPQF